MTSERPRCFFFLMVSLLAYTLGCIATTTEIIAEDEVELLTTVTSTTTGQIVEVSSSVAALLRNPNNVAEPETLRVPFNNIPVISTKRPLPSTLTTTTTTTPVPLPTTGTSAIPTTTITMTSTTSPPKKENTPPTEPPTEPREGHLVPRKVPALGPFMHSCPRPEDIHPCECLEIANHYNKSQLETVTFCKNIRNTEVLKVAMKGMKGHFINYFVLDSCKLPPFPNGLFHNIGIGWMEALNSTVQFQESFFSCSNGCW